MLGYFKNDIYMSAKKSHAATWRFLKIDMRHGNPPHNQGPSLLPRLLLGGAHVTADNDYTLGQDVCLRGLPLTTYAFHMVCGRGADNHGPAGPRP